MAKRKIAEEPPLEEENEESRPIGEDERIEETIVSEDTDLFDEVLGTEKTIKLKEMVDKNDPIEDEEEDSEEDNDEEDDSEEDEEAETEEEKENNEKSKEKSDDVDEKELKEIEETPEEEENEEEESDEEDEKEESDEEESEEEETKKSKKQGKEDSEEDETEEEKEESDEEESDEEPDEDELEKDDTDEDENLIIDSDAKDPLKEELEEIDEEEKPDKEEIKNIILKKAETAAEGINTIPVGEKLEFLEDKENNAVFIGRKANIYKKFGYEAALQIGKVQETEHEFQDVYLDSLNPHVVFVCGARGSGKSYVLGVIAEELAEKNKNVGIIVVDPIGVFWSMRYPNKEEKEVEKLIKWGMAPQGLTNMKVFIPEGVKKEVPKSTYDAGFAIQPSLLTGEDWALTFGIDRFSVSGLLLDKVLKKVEKGYKQKETNKKIPPKRKNFSIDDLVTCLETDAELNGKEKGYKPDSIRAISSRFEAAKAWGIFDSKGTPLGKLSRAGQMTVLDTSFLDDNVTALVIGILARRLLAARKISTRKEAANQFKELNMEELLELEIPPTWLFIDEAHTLIPSGNERTAATAGLIEYVKQGRRPGLSLVFATQQPSAINTKVLSQLDVIMTHKLIFDDDIKAVFKRTPTIIPKKYRVSNFIKTLPVGVAVTGDRREETSRAFVMGIRPRKSQHEGRDAETTGFSESLEEGQVEKIAVGMIAKDVEREETVDIEKAQLAVETLNNKYNTNINVKNVLRKLEEKGFIVGETSIMVEGYVQGNAIDELTEEEKDENEEDEVSEEEDKENETSENSEEDNESEEERESVPVELLSLPKRIPEEHARLIVQKIRKKKLFGLLGNADRIESIQIKYFPMWRVKFDVMTRGKEFISRECFINSISGEFVHFKDGNFIESKGLRNLSELNEEEVLVMNVLSKKELLIEEIMAQTELEEAKIRRVLQKLMEKSMIEKITDKKTGKIIYWVKEKIDLPPNEKHEMLSSIASLPFVKAEALSMERENYSKEEAAESLKKLWPSVIVKKTEALYKPVWHIVLSVDAKERTVLIDAVNGKIISQ
ncbi:MAG: ATP-binding protein [archaeon]|nr:ATP-binding protein [archaeon]